MSDWTEADLKRKLKGNPGLAARNPGVILGLMPPAAVVATAAWKPCHPLPAEGVTFTVPGDPVGFRSMGKLPKDRTLAIRAAGDPALEYGGKVQPKRRSMVNHIRGCKRTVDYYRRVRECATEAGVPLPLVASNARRVSVAVFILYPVKTKKTITGVDDIPIQSLPDPRNVQKGVEDALFYGGKGQRNSDFACVGPVDYGFDASNPRVIVTIKPAGPALVNS